MAAVILFGFLALNYSDFSVKGEKASVGDVVLQSGILESKTEGVGILSDALGVAIPAAQASVDFSADDELENQDYLILSGSGITAQNNSNPDPFSGLRHEVVNYVVQEGDTPFDIAIKFSINTDTVLWANNLKDGDLIKPGQQLTILPINGVRVKIVAKDTLASLAKKYNGKVEEIISYNNLADDNLKAGNYLIIPNGEMPTPVSSKSTPLPPSKITAPTIGGNWLIAPTTGTNWGKLHGQNGVDVANACGTAIYAAAAGKVTLADSAGWNDGYGKYIMIKHPNGVVTLYAHASQLLVNAGEQVAQGQLIALMGTTGRSTGCHLHFEVRGAKNPLAR